MVYFAPGAAPAAGAFAASEDGFPFTCFVGGGFDDFCPGFDVFVAFAKAPLPEVLALFSCFFFLEERATMTTTISVKNTKTAVMIVPKLTGFRIVSFIG
jgi:hypothetical protein